MLFAKRCSCVALSLVLLCTLVLTAVPFAGAESTTQEIEFSGTIDLPAVNGLQFGMHMPVVLLAEQNAGRTLTLLDGVSLSDLAESEIPAVQYICNDMTLLGEKVSLTYDFRYNVLRRVYISAQFDTKEAAVDYVHSVKSLMEEKYGEYTDNYTGVFTEEDKIDAECIESFSNGPHFSWNEDVMPEHVDFTSDIELYEPEDGEPYEVQINLGGGYNFPQNVTDGSLSFYDERFFK